MTGALILKEFENLELGRALNPQSKMAFYGNLENEKVEINGGLDYDVSELSKDSIKATGIIFWIRNQ